MSANDRLSRALRRMQADPWRHRVAFSADLEEALQSIGQSTSDTSAAGVLNKWLQLYQPCLFGRVAAQRGLLSYCIVTDADIAQGDDFVRDKIQSSRTAWSADAFAGTRSGFVIAVISPQLTIAVPDEAVAEFARRLVGLYLLMDDGDIQLDRIYLDDVRLEVALPGRPTWQWDVGVNYFSAQGDGRWWHDHRVPVGMALSMNSVGHMVKSTIQSQTITELEQRLNVEAGDRADSKLDSLDKALRMAMMTIDRAAETSSGRATWLLQHPGPGMLPECPIALPSALATKNHCEYSGYYHTDFTLPSAYFLPNVERPQGQALEKLDFTYLNQAAADPIDRARVGSGRRVRSMGAPSESPHRSKSRKAHPRVAPGVGGSSD